MSRHGNHATATEDHRLRELVPNAVAGQPALFFDGEDHELRVPVDLNPSVNPEITVFVVFNSETDERVYRKIFGHDDGGYDRAVGLDGRGSTNFVFFGGRRGTTQPIIDIAANEWYLLTMT